MEKYIIAIDVGGTGINAGIVNEDLVIYQDKIVEYPSKAQESKEVIINNFVMIIKDMYVTIMNLNGYCLGIGFGFPGPFDYKNGISLMKGIGKYDAIFNVDMVLEMKDKIGDIIELSNIEMSFLNDASAFALGEFYKGSGNHLRSAYITLGTGCGSSLIDNNGQFIMDSDETIYMVFNKPYRNNSVDHFISKRAIMRKATCYGLEESLTVEEIGLKATEGNAVAKKIFEDYGKDLGNVINQYIMPHRPKVIVLGGGISRAYELFEKSMYEQIGQKDIRIERSRELSKSAIIGAAAWLIG